MADESQIPLQTIQSPVIPPRITLRCPALRAIMRDVLAEAEELDLRMAHPAEIFGRLRAPGIVHEIELDVYLHFLANRPSMIGNRCFAVRVTGARTRVLWAHERQYYSRQLTEEETAHLFQSVHA